MRSTHGPSYPNRSLGGRALAGAIPCIIALGIVHAPRVARACSCSAPPAPQKALEASDAVFEARAFSMSTDTRQAHYRFEVDRVWKGEVPPRVEITTALHSATCGRSYQMGTQYVIYARRNNQGEWADYLCSRTRTSQAAAEDLTVLGAGHSPVDPELVPTTEPTVEPTEPPRIETPPTEPPPAEPSRRGCAVEKPHTVGGLGWLALMGLAVAIGRRRAVRSRALPRDRAPR